MKGYHNQAKNHVKLQMNHMYYIRRLCQRFDVAQVCTANVRLAILGKYVSSICEDES